jgi:hypothetical protein
LFDLILKYQQHLSYLLFLNYRLNQKILKYLMFGLLHLYPQHPKNQLYQLNLNFQMNLKFHWFGLLLKYQLLH